MADLPALATVDQVGAILQIDLDPSDQTVTFLLTFTSALIRQHLGQSISKVVDDVELCTPHSGVVTLRQFPITAISTVETLDINTRAWTVADPSTYWTSLQGGWVQPLAGYCSTWPADPETWRVTYTHGYDIVPSGLAGACASITARLYNTPVGVSSERLGQRSTSYTAADVFTPLELLVLGSYREARMS